MRSIVVREFGGPEVMQVETVPDPTPSASQVLVRIRAAGVNPVDTYIRSGAYAREAAAARTRPGPTAPARCVAVGAEVSGVQARRPRLHRERQPRRRRGPALCAEQALCAPTQLHHLPARRHLRAGRGDGRAVRDGVSTRCSGARNAQPGETVLVHGASGGVGIAAVELARAHGMFVIGTASTERGPQAVRAARRARRRRPQRSRTISTRS